MPRQSREVVRFTLDLPSDLHRKMRVKAFEQDVHAAEVCRELIGQWVDGVEADLNTDALREAYASGVRAERERVLRAVTGVVDGRAVGLPTQRPVSRV